MPKYRLQVQFLYETDIYIEADSAEAAEAMFVNATHDEIAHINGRSFAHAEESTRSVVSTTEVV